MKKLFLFLTLSILYISGYSQAVVYKLNYDTVKAKGDIVAVSINKIPITRFNPTSPIQAQLDAKQAILVSGSNIKTVNLGSIVGGGNLTVGDALVANSLSQFAATTSAQLLGIISDETGSGTLVFGTSPILVTPALGTPSAINLTNATGFPTLNQNTTGSAGSVVSSLTNGYGVSTLTYNGSITKTIVIDTATAIKSKLSALADYNNLTTRINNGAVQPFEYVITTNGTTITAVPRNGSGLTAYSGTDAYTVWQNAINACQTGNGCSIDWTGTYNFSDEVVITGWNSNSPATASITIKGHGLKSQITQTTSGKNAFVIKNNASIDFEDFYVYTGTNAKSGIFLSDAGTNEISVFGGVIKNIFLSSDATSAPAFYAKNFFDLQVDHLYALNSANNGIVLENNSTTTNYGNSHFSFVRASGNNSSPFAGIKLISNTVAFKYINQISFDNFQAIGGYYGVYMQGAIGNTFNHLDVEYLKFPIYYDGTANNEVLGNRINSGYILPQGTGATGITATQYAGGNTFNMLIDGTSTVIPVSDVLVSGFRASNNYDLTLGATINASLISVASTQSLVTYRKASDGLTVIKGPGGSYSTSPTLPASTVTSGMLQLTSGASESTTPVNNTMAYDGSALYYYSSAGAQRILATQDRSETLTNKTIGTGGVISSSVTGTTQAFGDNSNKVSTTAYGQANFAHNVLVSNVQLVNTGNTTENTLYTGTIPASSIGTNGSFAITLLTSATNNANAKTINIKIGGTTIASITNMVSNAFGKYYITLHNRNSASVQVAGNNGSQAQVGFGTSTIAPATYAFNTAGSLTLTITAQNAVGTDAVNIEAFQLVANP